MNDTKLPLNAKLTNLLKIAPIAREEKDIWLEKLPEMDEVEKGLLAINLWKEIMVDFQDKFMQAVNGRIDEMAENEHRRYKPADFKRLKSEMLQELVRRVSEGQDTLKLEEIRGRLRRTDA